MSKFVTPDLNAPRYRAKVKNILNKDLFNAFLEKHPKYKGTLDKKDFREIIMAYSNEIKNTTINTMDGVELPESLGYLIIAKCDRAKKLNIDYKVARDSGKIINCRNWESDDYLAKICYSNYSLKYRFADRALWAFKPDKKFRQIVSKTFPEMYQNYIHLSDKTKLSQLY